MNSDRVRFPRAMRFVSIDPAHNRARFYTLSVQETLWGEAALVCTWGRIGGAGRNLARVLGSQGEALAAFDRAVAQRIRRGYRQNPSRAVDFQR